MNIKTILEFWPDEISLLGSKVIPETDGFLCPILNSINEKIELDEDVESFKINWAIFQEYHRIAKLDFEKGKMITLKSNLSIEKIKNNLRE